MSHPKSFPEIQREISQQLHAIDEREGSHAKILHITSQLKSLESDISLRGLWKRYLYAMHVLVHQEAHGGIGPTGVKNAKQLIESVLVVLEGKGKSTQLLRADYHAINSQLYRMVGSHWLAGWEQLNSGFYSKEDRSEDKGFESLSLGSRYLRLGEVRLALFHFDHAVELGLTHRFKVRCLMGKLRALRLQKRKKLLTTLHDELLTLPNLAPLERNEILWEKYCADGPNLADLVKYTRKDKPHHLPTYLVESFLWTRAVSDRHWLTRYPTLRSFIRSATTLTKKRLFFRFAYLIEEIYRDKDTRRKIPQISPLITEMRKLLTIDKELLILVALARWFTRRRLTQHATFLLSEYEALSLRISDQRDNDALGIAEDLLSKPWFLEQKALPFKQAV